MKYLGGKQRLGKYISFILHELWNKYNTKFKFKGYMEPFCGSLGVFKHMTDLNTNKIIANDYHPDLIELWNSVKYNKFHYPKSISEDQYNKAKLIKSPSAYKAFVGFGMSFGGRYFGAYSQKYLGNKKEDFCKEMTNSLKKIAPMIQDKKVKFTNKDYKSLNLNNMFIYCDPPYQKTLFPIKYRTSTKKYDRFDNEEFWDIMREWSKSNVVVISETHAPKDFKCIWKKTKYRSAAQSKKTRFKTMKNVYMVEKLFMHETLL